VKYYEENGINWWRSPPESPDINPIENLWSEMKAYIRRHVKPTSLAELIAGCNKFWRTVDVEKCNRYINHLKKVVPAVVRLKGYPTGY